MATPILNIQEIAQGVVNVHLVANEAFRKLESAFTGFLDIDFASGNVTLSSEVFRSYMVFRSLNNATARTINVPAVVRCFIVVNGGTAELSVVRGASLVSIGAGKAAFFFTDGTTNGLTEVATANEGGGGGGGGGGVSTVVNAVSVAGILDLSEVDAETVNVPLNENISTILLPTGQTGVRKDLLLRFVQDATGGRTVSLSAFAWQGDGIAPEVDPSPLSITYVAATNVSAFGWEGFK